MEGGRERVMEEESDGGREGESDGRREQWRDGGRDRGREEEKDSAKTPTYLSNGSTVTDTK